MVRSVVLKLISITFAVSLDRDFGGRKDPITQMKLKYILATLIALSVLGGAFLFSRSRQKLVVNWTIGDRRMYQFSVHNRSEIFIKMNKNRQEVESQTSGILNLRILERKEDRIFTAVQFSPVEILLAKKSEKELSEIYETMFLVEFLNDGMPYAFHFPAHISEEDSRSVVSVLRNFQVKLLNDGEDWLVKEINSDGEAVSQYKPESSQKIKKQNLKYDTLFLKKEENATEEDIKEIRVLFSEFEFLFSKNASWLESAKGKEGIFYDSSMAEVKSTSDIRLEEIPFTPNLELAIWKEENKNFQSLLDEFKKGEKKKTSYWEDKSLALLQKEYGTKSFPTMLNSFWDRFEKDYTAEQELKDYLLVHPEKVLEFPNLLLQDPRVSAKAADRLIHILEKVGTPQAQTALRRIVQNPNQNFQNRISSLISTALLRKPTGETYEFLWEIYNDKEKFKNKDKEILGNSAILALGHYVNTQKGVSLTQKEDKTLQIKEKLKDELQKVETNSEKSILLEAIGNTRDESFFKDVKKFTEAKDLDTRKSAFHSMRFMKQKEAQLTLTEGLRKEQDARVKDTILDVLISRKADTESLQKVETTINNEKSDAVRFKMYKYLIVNKKMLNDRESIFKKYLESETDPSARELLYKGMYSERDLN